MKLKTTAIFEQKRYLLESTECEITKVIKLSGDKFDYFCNNLLKDYDFISENKDCMREYEDRSKACLLVIGKGREHGVLVDSQGYNYARYTAYLPNAMTFIENQMQSIQKRIDVQLKLKDLIHIPFPNDIYLIHNESNMGFVPVSGLSDESLSEQMRKDWADVFNADAVKIYPKANGIHIEVANVDAQRLQDFGFEWINTEIEVEKDLKQYPEMNM